VKSGSDRFLTVAARFQPPVASAAFRATRVSKWSTAPF
jgi:hypothetical protein